MATKPKAPAAARKPQKRSSPARGAAAPGGPGLTPTERAGVFRNSAGILVNEAGVMLSLLEAKKADGDEMAQVLGRPVATPADVLTATALDPRLPLSTRVDAAKAAAPYTDRKKPVAVDGGVDPTTGEAKPIGLALSFPPHVLAAMSEAELSALESALAKVRGGEGAQA